MIGQVFAPASLEALWPLLEDGFVAMAGGTDLLVRLRAGRAQGPRSRDGDDSLGCASPSAMLRAKAASTSEDDPLADAQPALAATAEGVVITDRNGIIQWANAAFGRITGYLSNDTFWGLLGKMLADIEKTIERTSGLSATMEKQ